MKVALVHDWLVTDAGAEKVFRALCDLYPDAEIFALVDFLDDEARERVVRGKYARTSFIQRLPRARTHFRHYLPLFPAAIESLDLRGFDLIISSSWAVAKGVRTQASQRHLCYCHTPIRYAWDLFDEYTDHLPWPKRPLVRRTLRRIREWDRRVSDRVDCFVANSAFVADRIARSYGRDAEVVYPPVDTGAFVCHPGKKDYYLTASRLVGYKKTRLIVEAFNRNGHPLQVIGDGEMFEELCALAGPNVEMLGYQPRAMLIRRMQEARAFVYAALEDFGIVPVEAMACGTPVIAYGRGGVQESVASPECGLFFDEQTPEALCGAVERFESLHFDPAAIAAHAAAFAREHFDTRMQAAVTRCLDAG